MAIDYGKFLQKEKTFNTRTIDYGKFLPRVPEVDFGIQKKQPTPEDFATLGKFMRKGIKLEKARRLVSQITKQQEQREKLEEIYRQKPWLRPEKPEPFIKTFGKELARTVFPVISEIERIPVTEPLLRDKDITKKILKEVPGATVEVAKQIGRYVLGLPIEFGLDMVSGIKVLSGGKPIQEIDTRILGKIKPHSGTLKSKFERGRALAEMFGARSETSKNIGGILIPFITEDILRAVATGGTYAKIGMGIGQSINYTKVGDFNIKNADYTPPGAEKQPKISKVLFGKQKEATIAIKDNKGQVGFAEVKQKGQNINIKLYAPKEALKPTTALTVIPKEGAVVPAPTVPVAPVAAAGAVARVPISPKLPDISKPPFRGDEFAKKPTIETIPKELEPLAQEAMKFIKEGKTAEEFIEKINPIKIDSITPPRGRDVGQISVQFFPKKEVKGIGLTKDSLLSLLRDQKKQGIEIMQTGLGLTKEGEGFIKNIEDAGFIKKLETKPGFRLLDKLNNYKTKINLTDIFNQSKAKPVKLPEIKKPIEKGIKLTAGIDPGVDKFFIEDVKPIIQKAKESGKWITGIKDKVADIIWGKFKPIIPAEKAVGRKVPAVVIKAIHKPEAFVDAKWNLRELSTVDENIQGLEKWFVKNFSDKDLENLMLSRGNPDTKEGLIMRDEATRALPEPLKTPEITNAINEIADINYDYLIKVAGKDISKVEDYFYGIYKDAHLTREFLENWKTTTRFLKEKIFPTYADAKAFGLKLKSQNPIENLRAEATAIARLEATRWLRDELMRTGKGIYILEQLPAPNNWLPIINEPVFKGLRLEPNLSKLINSLLQANKISRSPALSFLRRVNNFLRTLKFVGSAFHLGVEAKQAIADTGYLKIGLKPTSYRGLDRGFKFSDPIFKTEVYKDYLENGGGHKYSLDIQAQKSLATIVDKINRGNFLGGAVRVPMLPVTINKLFIDWLFTKYIPKLKYAKYLDNVALKESKTGRPLSDVEKQDIIREGQNFYGEMNERLFGRSGTATSVLRFFFMAPGFAEGNFTTMVKAATEWGQGGKSAARSRSNMINSLLVTSILATVGTLIFTKKLPKKPKVIDDIRDLFKINTGYQDDKGRDIMIDLLTYDKDYFEVLFKVLLGKPGEAINYSIRRIGGMKSTTLGFFTDLSKLMMGEKLVDWKDDPVFYDTDDFKERTLKIAIHEMKRLEPISFSVYRSARQKEVSKVIAAIEALSGVRPTFSAEQKRKQKSLTQIYDLKGRQEELYYHLRRIDNPRDAIKDYNDKVNQILDSSMIPKEFKDEWSPKLLIDVDKFLSNKVYSLGQAKPKDKNKISEFEEEKERIKELLENFNVTLEEAERLLKVYYERHPVKEKYSKTNLENRRKRRMRVKKRF